MPWTEKMEIPDVLERCGVVARCPGERRGRPWTPWREKTETLDALVIKAETPDVLDRDEVGPR
jgi:hypothetical protein